MRLKFCCSRSGRGLRGIVCLLRDDVMLSTKVGVVCGVTYMCACLVLKGVWYKFDRVLLRG